MISIHLMNVKNDQKLMRNILNEFLEFIFLVVELFL